MNNLLFMGIGLQEILIVALLVLLFFGGKKIPELMKGLGKGVRSFKDGISDSKSGSEADKVETEEKPTEKEE